MSSYRRQAVSAPRVSGAALRALVAAVESPVGSLLLKQLTHDSGLGEFRQKDPGGSSPLSVRLTGEAPAGPASTPVELAATAARWAEDDPSRVSIGRISRAYREGVTGPVEVAQRFLSARRALDTGPSRLGLFIACDEQDVLRQAEAAAERLRAGKPLSVLDGVPIAVKDELDMVPYPTTLGTSIFTRPAARDATVVERLRAAGAVLVGKANMQEIGINPVGINPHHGTTRNPYDPSRISGGSSSGSAATVAAGLCPAAIGADGGGSIRIPAGLCGVVGLKATFGRISEYGVPPLCWVVGHVGPIGLTVSDVAILHATIAGPDARDAVTLHQPPVHLADVEVGHLRGLKLGICPPYFEDAEPEVVARCREVVRACEAAGASVVELPPPDLNAVLWSHTIIITSEMAAAMRPYLEEDASRFGLTSRINLAIGRYFRSSDLVHAMRHRQRITAESAAQLQTVDAIVTPTTASTAAPIPEAALPEGESNLEMVDALMRFIRVGNLTGFPALAVPAGYSPAGLPVSCHFLGRPFEEHVLLRIGRVVERAMPWHAPPTHTSLL